MILQTEELIYSLFPRSSLQAQEDDDAHGSLAEDPGSRGSVAWSCGSSIVRCLERYHPQSDGTSSCWNRRPQGTHRFRYGSPDSIPPTLKRFTFM